MSPSSSCLRCQEVLAVGSANGLCATCSKALETSRDISSRTPGPDDRTASRPELVGSTLTQQVANGVARTAWGDENGYTANWEGEVRLPNSPAGYDLYRYLGGGGMGDVYLAREHAAERTVAMKFLRGAPQSTAADRFLTEVRSLARLDHPNIIRVISVDLDRSDPHFTMEFAPGGTLSDWVKAKGPMPPLDAARIVAQVARAIEVAHGANILHRDLKPSNIVFGIDDIPKVTDFGLAKLTDRDEGLSMSTGPLGTPSFMPPEQISSKFGTVGPASDVYSLGATLYHLLTGRPPFQGDTPHDIITQVQNAQPERINSFRPEVPGDLEGIVVKCLEKETRHRYPTALALAEDLERFLAGQVPIAPRQTRLRRMRRWVGRNQWTISGAVGIIAAAITIGIGLAMAPVRQQQTPAMVDPLEEMRKDLLAGRSVTFIPEAGLPRWHRWLLGSPELIAAPKEPCQFESISYGLLELCPDPMVEHYILRAKMQFRESKLGPGGLYASVTSGFYFGQSAVNGSDNRRALAMVAVHYDDMLPRLPRPPDPLPDNVVRMQAVRLLFEPNEAPKSGLIGYPNAWTPISRTLALPGPWRALEVEVSPNRVTARFEAEGGQLKEFASVSADEIRMRYADLVKQLVLPPNHDIAFPVWQPRMPLGIWNYRAAIAVKDVTLTPLP